MDPATASSKMAVNTTDLSQVNLTKLMAEQQKQIYVNRCIYDPMPTAYDIMESMSTLDIVFHIVMLILATATVTLFVELVFFLQDNIKQSKRRRLSIMQAALPPVFAVSSLVGIFSPRGFAMIDFASSVFFGVGIHTFLLLMVDYYGGISQLLLRFKKRNKKFVIYTGPLCCFFRCIPKLEMNRKNFSILWYATFQAAFLRPIILFFESVFGADKSIKIPSLVYGGFMIFSMLSGVWALGILKKASGSFLNKYRITLKFVVFQLILIISNLQPFLVKAFYLDCHLPYTFLAKKVVFGYEIMIFEFFVLGLLTRFLYRQKSDDENLERILTDEKAELSNDKFPFAPNSSSEKKLLNGVEDSANGNHIILTVEESNRSDHLL